MVCTPAVKATIRQDKLHQIYGMMQAGHKHGMQTMNQALFNMYKKKEITREVAVERSNDAPELEQMIATGREIL